MNKTELQKIELKNDGKEAERFEKMLKTVVNVPKEELKKRHVAAKKSQAKNLK